MARRRRSRTVFSLMIVVGLALPSGPLGGSVAIAVGHTVKSKTITCVKGKLVRRVTGANPKCPSGYRVKALKANRITFSLLSSYKIDTAFLDLQGTSSAALPLAYRSLDTTTCAIRQRRVQLLTPGVCSITASQNGSALVATAAPVTVSFKIVGKNAISLPLPSSLRAGLRTYTLPGTSSSGLPLHYETLTPDVCAVVDASLSLLIPGQCAIRATQPGSDIYEVAEAVEVSTTIVETRVTSDQPDLITGFQIKPVYVVPADGVDHFFDTNGFIEGILDEGNAYLKDQISQQLPIDRTNLGYDIQFLKTKMTTADLMHSSTADEQLFNELGIPNNPGVNRKNYTFFIDVQDLRDGSACGYALNPGMISVVAIGTVGSSRGTCSGPAQTFKHWESLTWVHENFHNFGVPHFNDSCDLMNGGNGAETMCATGERPTIDLARSRYIGASAVGYGSSVPSQNVMQLRIWDGYTSRMDMLADCQLNPGVRTDGVKFAYCPTGVQQIGALTYCRNFYQSISLEERVNGSWVSLGSGSHWYQPWGDRIDWTCSNGMTAPWKELTVNTPGLSQYRWVIDGAVSEYFDILWVQ
ncbi:MAG TPA: hypothetical protein VMV52_10860 [Candidatus Nanopelagicaceae bacterium]|nr:hypothetical protein [Candidatus Nanopelagicaceae bacterium]